MSKRLGTTLFVSLAVAACAVDQDDRREPTGEVASGLWGGWEALGGKVDYGGVAVTTWGPGRLDWFYPGSDHTLRHRWYAGGWSGEENLGGQIASTPAAVAWGPGRLDIVAVGLDQSIQHLWYQGGWGGWEPLPVAARAAFLTPAIATGRAGALDIFYVSEDLALHHLPYAEGWKPEEVVPGRMTGGVAAISTRPGEIDLFSRGAGNALVHDAFVPADTSRPWGMSAHWTGWESLGGSMASDPAVASWGPGRLDVFYTGSDVALKHRWRASAGAPWGGEESLGGLLDVTTPGVVSWGAGRIDIFAASLAKRETFHQWWQDGYGGAPPALVDVYRLYGSDHHFYTQNKAEADGLVASGWRSEGTSFRCWNTMVPGSTPLHRFYNGATGDHYYTTGAATPAGYRDEGIVCWVPTLEAGTCTLNREWNGADHFMTVSASESNYAFQCLGYHLDGDGGGWSTFAAYVYPPAGGTCEPRTGGPDADTYERTRLCPGGSPGSGGGGSSGGGGGSSGGGGGGSGGGLPAPQCSPGVAIPLGCPAGQYCYALGTSAICGSCGGTDQICCPAALGYECASRADICVAGRCGYHLP